MAFQFLTLISFSGQQTGAIFEDSTFYNDDIQMLQYATAEANEKILQYGTGMRLGSEVQTVAYGREYSISKRVCALLEVRSIIMTISISVSHILITCLIV